MHKPLLALTMATALLAACGGQSEPPPAEPAPEAAAPAVLPDTIVAERGGFIPEGVEYDTANDRFLTGSIAEGSIFQIHPDGRVSAVVSDPDLVSSIGIEVDESRDLLLVANADATVFQGNSPGQAKLGVYRLSSGERLAMVDLATAIADPPADAAYFANDVAVGADGTAFVTDTRMNVVYSVSPDYRASVLHRFEPSEDFAPNGIAYHASGFLLVAGGRTLWKVPIDNPAGATQVTLSEEVAGQDGIVWAGDDRLAIVSNSSSQVVVVTSTDAWQTAQQAAVATYEMQATTAAVVGDDIYVLHPHFGDDEPPSLERVTLQ